MTCSVFCFVRVIYCFFGLERSDCLLVHIIIIIINFIKALSPLCWGQLFKSFEPAVNLPNVPFHLYPGLGLAVTTSWQSLVVC